MSRLSLLLTSLAASMCLALQAQSQNVSLVLGAQPQSIWQLDFVNNVIITNTGNDIQCNLQFDILKTGGTQVASVYVTAIKVMSGSSALRQLSHGKTTVKYGDDASSAYLQSTQSLPAGGYVFNASLLSAATGEVLSTASMESPMFLLQTPLRLQYPNDGDTIFTIEPTLQWIPPQPTPANLDYTLLIYRTNAKGKKVKAASMPLKKAGPLEQPVFSYATQSPALEFEHTYTWKVIASVDGYQVDESDTWLFTPSRKNEKSNETRSNDSTAVDTTHDDLPYWVLDNRLDEGFYEAYTVCKIHFTNASTDSVLNYSLRDLSEPTTVLGTLPALAVTVGANFKTIPLNQISGMQTGRYYLLHIRMRDLTEYKVRFKYYDNL